MATEHIVAAFVPNAEYFVMTRNDCVILVLWVL